MPYPLSTSRVLPQVIAVLVGSLAFLCLVTLDCVRADSTRVKSVEVLDRGSAAEGSAQDFAIDLVQGFCGEEPNQTDEPFNDTYMAVAIRNSFPVDITAKSIRYRLRTSAGGAVVYSKRFAPAAGSLIGARSEGRVLGIFLKATSGHKAISGSSSLLATDLGVQNVMVQITFQKPSRGRFVINKRIALAFGDYNRC